MPITIRSVYRLIFVFILTGVAHTAAVEAEHLMPRLIERTAQWREQVPAMQASAAAAAKGVIAGGQLYLAGPQPSFTPEGTGRSGGLLLARPYNAKTLLTDHDTVLAALTGDEDPAALQQLDALLAAADAAGARVVLFANSNQKRSDRVTVLPEQPFASQEAVDNAPSIESVSNVIALWTWTGQFVAECVRQGQMPCFYESFGVPGGRERAASMTANDGGRFHVVSNVTAEDAAPLADRYLDAVDHALRATWQEDRSALDAGAALLREARDADRTVRIEHIGHMFPAEFQTPRNPAWLSPSTETDEPLAADDVVILLQYQAFPWEAVERIGAAGGVCILTSSHVPPASFGYETRNVYIDPHWSQVDAVATLPGYDAAIFPISGVMQSAIYWQLVELAQNPPVMP